MNCEWEHFEDGDGFWVTECKHTFKKHTSKVFVDHGYKEVNFIFFPSCGNKIEKVNNRFDCFTLRHRGEG